MWKLACCGVLVTMLSGCFPWTSPSGEQKAQLAARMRIDMLYGTDDWFDRGRDLSSAERALSAPEVAAVTVSRTDSGGGASSDDTGGPVDPGPACPT